MPRPRLPVAKAAVSGAAMAHPERHRDRKVPRGTRPIGDAYKSMTPGQVLAWEEFRAELPWLNSSHRALLQVACILRARLNDDSDIGVNQLQTYSAILSKLAATPTDESKVTMPDGDETDPADQFFGRPN